VSQFKVGDVCVLVDGPTFVNTRFRPFIGRECTIIGYATTIPGEFRVDIAGASPDDFGLTYFCAPSAHLRLKRPPSDDTHLPADEEFTDWLRKQCGVKA
jgi:hypothetical protein